MQHQNPVLTALSNCLESKEALQHSGKTESLGWGSSMETSPGLSLQPPTTEKWKEEGENKEHKQIQALWVTLSINLNLVSAYSKWAQPQNAALVK